MLAEPLAVATNNLFQIVMENFLPTPAKPHYIFNMRDMSKVFQGLYRSTKDFYENREHIVKLWSHEILRIFHDRLISEGDREKLKGYLNEQLETHFQMSLEEHCQRDGVDLMYSDFMNDQFVYEEV